MNRRVAGLALATVLLAATALVPNGASAGTVLYNNVFSSVSNSYYTYYPSAGEDSVSSAGPLYDSFSTGSASYIWIDVTVLFSDTTTESGQFEFLLLSDNSNSPGSVIAQSGFLPDVLCGPCTYGVSGAVSLAANSRYWIELSSNGSSQFSWYFEPNNDGTGVAGEYWSNVNGVYANDNYENNERGPYQMEVIASNTPLPSTWTMMLIGLAVVGFFAYPRKMIPLPS